MGGIWGNGKGKVSKKLFLPTHLIHGIVLMATAAVGALLLLLLLLM